MKYNHIRKDDAPLYACALKSAGPSHVNSRPTHTHARAYTYSVHSIKNQEVVQAIRLNLTQSSTRVLLTAFLVILSPCCMKLVSPIFSYKWDIGVFAVFFLMWLTRPDLIWLRNCNR